jgi:hypothetical protein
MDEAWARGLRERLDAIYARLAAGEDLPPALRLKAEGYAEAGLELGLASAGDVAALIDAAHLERYGVPVADCFPYSARECIDPATRCVRIPARMRRAPVYPTTKD